MSQGSSLDKNLPPRAVRPILSPGRWNPAKSPCSGNHCPLPPGTLRLQFGTPRRRGGESLSREEAEKGGNKHAKTRSGRARSTESVSMGSLLEGVSGADRSAADPGPMPGAPTLPLSSLTLPWPSPSPFAPQPCTHPSPPPHPPSQTQPSPPNTLPAPAAQTTSHAAPSPETTSASLGPTVWQLPMTPAGRTALETAKTTTAAGPQPAPPAAPSLSRHPQRPPAPLRGRSPAGSVAAEGGAGTARRAARSASRGRQHALSHRGPGRGAQPASTPGGRRPPAPAGRLDNRPAIPHLPAATLQ